MDNFEIQIVIDKEILEEIPNQGKYVQFLIYWLSENNTKAVIVKKWWNQFLTQLEKDYEEINEEIKNPFFNLIKGYFRPYNKDGIINKEEDPHEETKEIINRDYDIVEYLITKSKEKFKGSTTNIDDKRIVDLKEFYTYIELEDSDFVKEFEESYKSLIPS